MYLRNFTIENTGLQASSSQKGLPYAKGKSNEHKTILTARKTTPVSVYGQLHAVTIKY